MTRLMRNCGRRLMQENLCTAVLTLRETFQMMVLFRVIQYSCFAGCYYTYQN